MEVKAKAKYIRMSPRKVRLVADVVRGLAVEKAMDQLVFVKKHAVRPIEKLLNSAVANAENNFELEKKNLYIKEIKINEGPTLKRWKPRARGRATPIRKRTSHIDIVLAELVESHVTNISRYERGENKPTTEVLTKIANALDVTTDYLMDGSIDDKANEVISDKELLSQFQKVSKLPIDKKTIVKELIDAFLIKFDLQQKFAS